MTIAETLLLDLEPEFHNTRVTLERIPEHEDKPAFRPHAKSMAFGRLAVHVATIPDFGTAILTTPSLDISTWAFPDMKFYSREKLLADFDASSAKLREALTASTDESLQQVWRLTWGEKLIAEGQRALLYRTQFFNHMIHHRAQLGVYLRLNDLPVPPLYGPTADDNLGF
jgi:uncharacterized damage-inducible protein DinB